MLTKIIYFDTAVHFQQQQRLTSTNCTVVVLYKLTYTNQAGKLLSVLTNQLFFIGRYEGFFLTNLSQAEQCKKIVSFSLVCSPKAPCVHGNELWHGIHWDG